MQLSLWASSATHVDEGGRGGGGGGGGVGLRSMMAADMKSSPLPDSWITHFTGFVDHSLYYLCIHWFFVSSFGADCEKCQHT